MKVRAAIARQSRRRPEATALTSGKASLRYGELDRALAALALELLSARVETVGLLADNGLSWALADLAASAAGVCLVPLPLFFTPAQMVHALQQAGADALIYDPALPLPPALRRGEPLPLSVWPGTAGRLALRRWEPAPLPHSLPAGTTKITFTSGTTGAPKGVCLGIDEQERVAEALCSASAAGEDSRHLAALPLSTLLENVGGLYAPLLAGATAVLPPLTSVGLAGAAHFEAPPLIAALQQARATSTILVPQMLQALVATLEAQPQPLPHLRFVAVGGAPLSPKLLARAAALGLPLFEGYGLSECASVVALNAPGANRPGSVGRPLPHLQVHIDAAGEIHVAGNRFRGYAGEPAAHNDVIATGDLGHFDADGYLHLTGRRRNVFVTSFGRNVAPEWIERELCLHPAIAQAAVFGEARPFNVAVIVSRAADAAVEAAIAAVNADLPDYARISRWLRADAAFTSANAQCTANGRLRRNAIFAQYARVLDAVYADCPA